MTGRRGYTLIELLATMSLISAALTLLASWLVTVMQAQRTVGEHLRDLQVRQRLAQQFREDINAALHVVPIDMAAEPDVRLRLSLPDLRQVSYTVRKGMLERLLREGDELTHREQFNIDPQLARFEAALPKDPQRVVLWLAQPEIQQPPRPALPIEAHLGSDHQWHK